MITPLQCNLKFGAPDINFENKHMTVWDVPADINAAIQALPNKIYCNKIMVAPLEAAFRNIMKAKLTKEFKTWDGCFNVRKMRGLNSMSIHSWACAFDVNAAWNGLGKEPQLSPAFVKCITDAGFDWGGTWRRKDGMHFQLSKLD